MKNLLKSLVAVFAIVFAVSSCDTDPCKDVVCGEQGNCSEGICICNDGYEKDASNLCNTTWASKFVGSSLNSVDTCTSDTVFYVNYFCNITEVNEKTLEIENLGGFNNPSLGFTHTINIDVLNSYDVSINATDANNNTFEGTGFKSGNVLYFNYVVTYTDGVKDTCASTINY